MPPVTKERLDMARQLLTNAPQRFEGVTVELAMDLINEVDRLQTRVVELESELKDSIRLYLRPPRERTLAVQIRRSPVAGEVLPPNMRASWARDLKVPS